MNKKVLIGIIISVILVLGIGVFSLYQNKKNETKLITQVDRHLSAQDRKYYEDRITKSLSLIEKTQDKTNQYPYYLQLGQDEYALGDLIKSKEYFTSAIDRVQKQHAAYQGLFRTEAEMQDYADAETNIRKAIEDNPSQAELWKELIQFKIDRHVPDPVITSLYSDALQKTQKDTNNNVDIMTSYARWLESTGQLQAAKEYWQKAIVANPNGKKIYQAEIDRLDKLLKQQK